MIDWIRWEIKYYMSKLRSYRKRKGGRWYRVTPKYDGYYGTYWINRKPLYNEKIVQIENWC